MLSISGMLGPSSLQSQRPLWYDYRSEQPSESERRYFSKSLVADNNMSLPPERRKLQTSRGTSTCSELSSASLSSGSPMRSFGEEVCGASALFLRGGIFFLEGSNNTDVSSPRASQPEPKPSIRPLGTGSERPTLNPPLHETGKDTTRPSPLRAR